jgi:hypothetical protein
MLTQNTTNQRLPNHRGENFSDLGGNSLEQKRVLTVGRNSHDTQLRSTTLSRWLVVERIIGGTLFGVARTVITARVQNYCLNGWRDSKCILIRIISV